LSGLVGLSGLSGLVGSISLSGSIGSIGSVDFLGGGKRKKVKKKSWGNVILGNRKRQDGSIIGLNEPIQNGYGSSKLVKGVD